MNMFVIHGLLTACSGVCCQQKKFHLHYSHVTELNCGICLHSSSQIFDLSLMEKEKQSDTAFVLMEEKVTGKTGLALFSHPPPHPCHCASF